MRKITVDAPDWSVCVGREAVIPVRLDWPELRLTPEQVYANVIADTMGEERPYPDLCLVSIVIRRPR